MTTTDSQEIKLEWAPTAGIMFLLLLLIGTLVVAYWMTRKLWPLVGPFLQRRGVGNAVLIQVGTFSVTVGLSILVALGVPYDDGWTIAGELVALAAILGLFAGSQTVEEVAATSRIKISETLYLLSALSLGLLGVLLQHEGLPSYTIAWYPFLMMDGIGYVIATNSVSKTKEAAKKQKAATEANSRR